MTRDINWLYPVHSGNIKTAPSGYALGLGFDISLVPVYNLNIYNISINDLFSYNHTKNGTSIASKKTYVCAAVYDRLNVPIGYYIDPRYNLEIVGKTVIITSKASKKISNVINWM